MSPYWQEVTINALVAMVFAFLGSYLMTRFYWNKK